MSRPAEPDKRLELARRAVAILQREGLEVSMSRLADALGIKRPTLLYHFPTRSHIVEVALEDMLRDQAMFVLAKVAEHQHPIDRVFAQICAVHAYHQGREERVTFLSQAIATSSSDRMAAIIEVGNRVFEPHRKAAADMIRQGIDDGRVEPCDPDAVMAIVRALTDGLLVQRAMTGLELAPVHQAIWKQLLFPLKRESATAAKVQKQRSKPARSKSLDTQEMT